MEPTLIRCISYSDIYSKKCTFYELIKNISAEDLLISICSQTVQIHNQKLMNSFAQIKFFEIIKPGLPKYIQKKVENFIDFTIKDEKKHFNFINQLSSLTFINSVLQHKTKLPLKTSRTSSDVHNLFKAYLLCTQQWVDEQEKISNETDFENIDSIIQFYLQFRLPLFELQEFKDFRTQFVKASYFFKFCQDDIHFSSFLKIFLESFNLNDSDIYLYHIINFYLRDYTPFKIPCFTKIDDAHKVAIDFLETLVINNEYLPLDRDFKTLRDYPIYKLSNNTYLYLSLNFLIDKLYQGILFKMGKELIKKEATYKGKTIKRLTDFMSIYGQDFTETNLFYKCMELNFPNYDIKLKGSDIKELLKNAEPDYYMRKGKEVFLFEFKNCLLNAEVKYSYDYHKIREEFFIKFVKDRRGHPEGISQIINTIDKISKNEFDIFDKINNKDTIIYPIIIYTDSSFGLEGFNYILTKKFNELRNKYNFTVCHTTMINIDTLIKYQELFQKGIIKLNDCINNYHYIINNPTDFSDKILSFDIFLEKKIKDEGIQYSVEIPIMMSEFKALLDRCNPKLGIQQPTII